MQTLLYIVSGEALAVLLVLLTLFLVARVLRKQQRPGSSIAWILGIVLLPYIGIPAFIIFGGRKIHGLKKRKRRPYPGLQEAPVRLLDFDNPAEDVLTSQSVHPPSGQNAVDFVSDGQEAYHKLVDMLEGAQRSIYVETYILARDDVARTFVELLARKAAEGLDVRLLLDSYGSLGTTGRFVQSIREAGGKVETFMPLMPFRRNWSLNLRNHRKIFIVDCSVATIGGMNIGTEYMGPSSNPKRWIDTAAFVRGPSVLDLLEVFSTDWNFASADPLEFDRACLSAPAESSASGIVQVAASGPDVEGDPLYEAILTSIYAARERVWLVTPYFVPGEELFRALLLQARMGRDVRLILPDKSNHWLADLARGHYLRALQSAGGKVYLCRHRMIHAKNIVFDKDTAVIGTLNIDMRSLYLNFEVALFVYSGPDVQNVADWMEGLVDATEPLGDRRPTRLQQIAEQLSFLVSPLL